MQPADGNPGSTPAFPSPPPVCADYAQVFRRSKGDHLATAVDGLPQVGGALLAPADVPWPDPNLVGLGAIDMFTMSPEGEVAPAGVDPDVADAWMPAVQSLAARVVEALADLGVMLDGDAYITASANEAADVSHEPHFDDDMFVADDGMGLVAIVGQLDGPRIAIGALPIETDPTGPPTQLPLDPMLQARFDDGELSAQQVEAEHIVLFPGFLQLHSGPRLPEGTTEPRLLLVLRAQTVPAV